MTARVEVVECTEDHVELGEPGDVVMSLLDVGLVGCYKRIWVERARCFFGYDRFATLDVPRLKEELAVEIREINRVEVDDVHVCEAR